MNSQRKEKQEIISSPTMTSTTATTTTTPHRRGFDIGRYSLMILFGFAVLSFLLSIQVLHSHGGESSHTLKLGAALRESSMASLSGAVVSVPAKKTTTTRGGDSKKPPSEKQKERQVVSGTSPKITKVISSQQAVSSVADVAATKKKEKTLTTSSPKLVEGSESTTSLNNKSSIQMKKSSTSSTASSKLAGLSCEAHGGPKGEAAQEMVYWKDIPSDSKHASPFKKEGRKEYLTFEPDQGGWNNIRMAMETVLALAFAMGRTLVLPPEKDMYLLGNTGAGQRNKFSFSHFFHMEAIHEEHEGFDIISMQEFLQKEVVENKVLRNPSTGEILYPPNNRTVWDGLPGLEIRNLFQWLRQSGFNTIWDPDQCLAAFPASSKHEDLVDLLSIQEQIIDEAPGKKGINIRWEEYIGKPGSVNGLPKDRLREHWAGRKKLCIYNESMQAATLVHFPVDFGMNARLLVHFYAFLFFQDWKHDLWMKRFIRDHVRYIDEIQCAAARVVEAIRLHVRQRTNITGGSSGNSSSPRGEYDALHVRRGDFQYKETRVDAENILSQIINKIEPGSTLYIATDERNQSFFQPIKDKYDVVFLNDFLSVLTGFNTNYYGMVDQLVASRSRIFFGCWFSTFTGYINRLRGYHADAVKAPGYEQGIIDSWYYAMPDRRDHLRTYYPIKQSFYAREFPTSWRLIDTSLSPAGTTG